jgi:hypothetical protein
MKTINISPDESTLYETLRDGHSVQVRVNIPAVDEHEYDKGKTVKVIYENEEVVGKIVSDPLEVSPSSESAIDKTLSLIIEKS